MAAWVFLYRWALGVWTGALLAFFAVFAPALFRSLAPPEAGGVVRQVVPVLDAAGLWAVTLALLASLRLEAVASRAAKRRLALLLATALCIGVSLGYVTPRLAALRSEAQHRVSELSPEHPVRREFRQLHGLSSGLMALEWLMATLAFAWAPRRSP